MPKLHFVCGTENLPEGQSFVTELNSKPVGVYRIDGELHAIDDMCPHMGASLSAGPVEDKIVTCPWHFWRFRLTDGAWADNPRIKIGCYKVIEQEDKIWIELPD
ncbi:Rieske (2Fe-2S) protein [Telmatocola sphagniphila]|uniref:Rieske (2Fe-2S) protein n=1 Tax=Telmatocola sphagniphila TaxID=1123043 RepID=A0A8E6B6Y7_9BACT|nr:Rieske (2Fe-2S) protein [Telmatocola sphagniphila]QVL32866.1 Rieske (2Fe-2S) protein [Telmatocola sphagniphila]